MTTCHKLWSVAALTAAFGLGYLTARPSSAPVNVVTGPEARQAAHVASQMCEPLHFERYALANGGTGVLNR